MPYYHIAISKKTGRNPWAFAFDMSLETIQKEIIRPLKEQKTFLCGKSMISPTDIEDISISETEKPKSEILGKRRVIRFLMKLSSTSKDDHIEDWAVLHAGKNVTRKLLTGLNLLEEQRIPQAGAPEISKEELKKYLEEFLRLYRSEVKKKYPAYFNEFPFYPALRAIGVISPHHVYIVFTRDGNPKTTTIEVFDENDIPELLRIKDAFYPYREEVYGLLGVKTYILDLVRNLDDGRIKGLRSYFVEPNISTAVNESIKNHHTDSVERGQEITWAVIGGQVAATVIPKFSFAYNTLDETKLSDKINDIIERVEEGEVLIAEWVDSYGMRLLNSLTERNIKFRIVTHKPTPSEGGRASSDTLEAFSKLAKEYTENVRILPKLHARLLISGREALVSTADLTKESMGAKYEAGISTTDGLAIIQLKEFFEILWKAGTKLNTPKAKNEGKT